MLFATNWASEFQITSLLAAPPMAWCHPTFRTTMLTALELKQHWMLAVTRTNIIVAQLKDYGSLAALHQVFLSEIS